MFKSCLYYCTVSSNRFLAFALPSLPDGRNASISCNVPLERQVLFVHANILGVQVVHVKTDLALNRVVVRASHFKATPQKK